MQQIFASLLLFLSVAVPSIHAEPLIRGAFGMRLGEPVDASRLTSKPFKSEKYLGTLHHYFRPEHPHPIFYEYSVWVTPKSRTVIAIRALSGVVATRGLKNTYWDRWSSVLKEGLEDCYRSQNRLAVQLDGRYNLLRTETEGNRRHFRGFSGYHHIWYKYTDGNNNFITLGCRDYTDWEKDRHRYHVDLELYYRLGNYYGLLSREGAEIDEARGL